jgi:hypothetical protein
VSNDAPQLLHASQHNVVMCATRARFASHLFLFFCRAGNLNVLACAMETLVSPA